MATVFLAEDAALQAKIYQRALLKLPDLEVVLFEDGLEVYREAFLKRPGFLILDVNLPSLSGGAVLRLLKFDRLMGKVPVLILSADQSTEAWTRSMRADGYLAKPIKPEQLAAEVTRLLGRPPLVD